MRKEIPEPNRVTSVVISDDVRLKADRIAFDVRERCGKQPSLSLIVHRLISNADPKRLAVELAAEVER